MTGFQHGTPQKSVYETPILLESLQLLLGPAPALRGVKSWKEGGFVKGPDTTRHPAEFWFCTDHKLNRPHHTTIAQKRRPSSRLELKGSDSQDPRLYARASLTSACSL